MYLRKIRPRGRGKNQVYWELVESYRTPKGSRQRTVAYLGKLSGKEVSGWEKLTGQLKGRPPAPPMLFERCDDSHGDDADRFELVDIKHIVVRRLRNFGDVFLGYTLWRTLKLDELLARLIPQGREQVPWPLVAATLCIARFCRPSSELHIEQHFYPQSALDDLLGIDARQVHTDRLYAGLDQLLAHKQAIEQHFRQRLGELFKLDYDVLLYDLTSTYFEGQCAVNPQACRGYSRDSRPDCPQVVIALIVTTDGYPLGYEVFPGNTGDSTTVQEIVAKVETEHGIAKRIWVMDRGNVSEANLAFIRGRGGHYIVGTPKAMLRQVQGQISKEGWRQVREGIEVKRVTTQREDDAGNTASRESANETFILCRSQERVIKETAMLERFTTRLEQGLMKLRKAAESGRLKELRQAHVRLGRLLEQNWRAAGCFVIDIAPIANPTGKAKLSVTWTRDAQPKLALRGCYLLRTNLKDPDPVQLWQQYIQLVDAEWAFRISKDELELRPIWHQHEHRVQGHILVCFIAYAMWKTLSGWMAASGMGDAPRPLVEELATIKSADVVLPTKEHNGSSGTTLVVRCVTRPDEHQAVLLNRLGVALPNHLRRFGLTPEQATARTM
jgi:Transposase DDE domain